MGLPSRRRLKKELSRKLLYYPLLRMLLFKAWFRAAFLLALATGLLLALYLPKVWRTSPDDFNPIIKVSALDMTQAWSLKRSARKAQNAGKHSEAFTSWQAAVAQNPADENAVRDFLRNFLHLRNPNDRQTTAALSQTLWLLRLTSTNTTDVELCAQVYEKFRWHDAMAYAFGPFADKLSQPAAIAYTKALFHQGRMTEFARRLKALENSPDPSLKLYRMAHQAGWGVGSAALEAKFNLQAAMEQPDSAVLAHRLYLPAAERRGDLVGFEKSLQFLAARNEAGVADHASYWRLLAGQGRKEDAVRLAEGFTTAPASAVEVLKLAQVYFHLGLLDQSSEVLKQFAPQFGHSPEVWASYASVLEEREDWAGMRAASLQIRDQRNYHDTLGGFSHYLEGRAELGQGRIPTAEIAFRKAGEAAYSIPSLGYLCAKDLARLKYPQYALAILKQIESEMASRPDYWEAVFDTGFQLRDGEAVLKAAEALYKEDQSNVVTANRYAAALMVNRARPDEAIRVTLQIMNAYSHSGTAVINHALALLLNKRLAEAKAELDRINVAVLNPIEKSAYSLGLFEYHALSGNYAEARRALDGVNTQMLFPAQNAFVQEQLQKFPATLTSAL